jgi:hypothetical protein
MGWLRRHTGCGCGCGGSGGCSSSSTVPSGFTEPWWSPRTGPDPLTEQSQITTSAHVQSLYTGAAQYAATGLQGTPRTYFHAGRQVIQHAPREAVAVPSVQETMLSPRPYFAD